LKFKSVRLRLARLVIGNASLADLKSVAGIDIEQLLNDRLDAQNKQIIETAANSLKTLSRDGLTNVIALNEAISESVKSALIDTLNSVRPSTPNYIK